MAFPTWVLPILGGVLGSLFGGGKDYKELPRDPRLDELLDVWGGAKDYYQGQWGDNMPGLQDVSFDLPGGPFNTSFMPRAVKEYYGLASQLLGNPQAPQYTQEPDWLSRLTSGLGAGLTAIPQSQSLTATPTPAANTETPNAASLAVPTAPAMPQWALGLERLGLR